MAPEDLTLLLQAVGKLEEFVDDWADVDRDSRRKTSPVLGMIQPTRDDFANLLQSLCLKGHLILMAGTYRVP